jgi:hypothetical protein
MLRTRYLVYLFGLDVFLFENLSEGNVLRQLPIFNVEYLWL